MFVRPNRRNLLKGGAAAGVMAAIGCPAIVRAQQNTLVVAGPVQMEPMLRANCFPEFEKQFNCKVMMDGGDSLANVRKLQNRKDDPVVSAIIMDRPAVIQADRLGLLDGLNAGNVPNLSQLFPSMIQKDGKWAAYKCAASSITYNPQVIPAGVPSWNVLWSEEAKDKVIIPMSSSTSLYLFLSVVGNLATGKPVGEAIREVDAIFQKVGQLRPNILMYFGPNAGQVFQLLETGGALYGASLTSTYVNARILEGSPLAVAKPSEGVPALLGDVAKVKNGPAPELADAFINEMLSAKWQKTIMEHTRDAASNKEVELLEGMTPAGDLIQIDWDFVVDNRDMLMSRFDREMAG